MSEQEAGFSMLGSFGRPSSGRIGGAHTGPVATARSGLKIEVKQIDDLNRRLEKTYSWTERIRKSLSGWNLPGTKGGANTAQNGMPLAPAPPGADQGTKAVDVGGVYSQKQMGAFAAFGTMNAIAGAMGSLDNRIDRGANYALTADRYNIMMQQQYGMTQNQVMNRMRKPLANYRMGPDGINAMMGFQQQTGFTATQQLTNSLSGIRAITGYSKTGQDVVNDQMSIMDPTVANRMLYMTGANAYTYGGGLNDPLKLRQQLTKSMGLTNAAILKGAKGPGSVTRARMADAGISAEMQDEILSYANENLTFQKKGGKGMYDPSKEADRKRMGIEGNFATEVEKTDTARQVREENFARRQLDNMASMEKNTREMVQLLGSIEDKVSGLVGKRINTRGWQRLIGSGLQIAGGIAAFTGVGAPAAIGMMGLGTALQGAAGDPVDADGKSTGTGSNQKSGSGSDSSIMVPYGYGGKRVPLDQLKSKEQFKSLNPKLQERLMNMFRANPNVGIGGGGRSEAQQRQMFLSRYRKTSAKTDIFWEGSYWEHVSGAAAAPPGRSMHEIGLAADLVGDMDWIKANAAKFGLRSFWDVNSEPWHVQPSELPGSRRAYEKSGAAWGTDGKGDTDLGTDNAVNKLLNPDTSESAKGFSGSRGGSLRNVEGMSISDIVAMMESESGSLLNGGLGPGNQSSDVNKGGTSTPPSVTGPVTPGKGGKLSAQQVAQVAFAAGFRGQDLIKMIAISGRESNWDPRAYNGNLGTGDQSYGLWQLNTLNSKKGGNMGDLVNEILGNKKGNTNFDALFDPATNAKVAYAFYQRNSNTLRPWGEYKGQSATAGAEKYMPQAEAAVKELHLGDPTGERRGSIGGGRGSTSISPTYNITIAPQITFVGTPQNHDLKRIANEVTGLIEQNVRTLEMRGA